MSGAERNVDWQKPHLRSFSSPKLHPGRIFSAARFEKSVSILLKPLFYKGFLRIGEKFNRLAPQLRSHSRPAAFYFARRDKIMSINDNIISTNPMQVARLVREWPQAELAL
jgi:hypothetical protein